MLSSLVLTALLATAPAAGKPNFVFLYSDDQRHDALGVVQKEQGEKARFPWFQTPNMDRIAREGFRFRNAFVVTALCSPSRACFLTGQYIHKHGIVNNRTPFPQTAITHASELKKAGYTTGYAGKFHMGMQSGQRPGFDWSASFVGQGIYFDCPVEVNGVKQETQGWIDDVTTGMAIDFIKKNQDQPFLLCLGFKAPHGPYQPATRHEKDFEGKTALKTPNFDLLPPFPVPMPRPPKQEGPQVNANLGYFRMIAGVDENVGRVLKALDELKLADNTVVVYSSDNGYYLGEHTLGDKRSAYEESLRIPLLVRYPKLGQGKTLDQMALNIDLAPTLLDFAGVAIPSSMQGKSWKPLLEGKAAPWRTAWFYEYFREAAFFTPTVTAVRTETAKLVKYPGNPQWNELFDLGKDPYETKNLIKDPGSAGLLKKLEAEYAAQAKAVDYKDPPEEPVAVVNNKALDKYVLDFRFAKESKGRIADQSGSNNHGTAVEVSYGKGGQGKTALALGGKGRIDVAKSESLNPAGIPWRVEARVQAEARAGAIVSRGGASFGYCLYLDEGIPSLAVVNNGKVQILKGKSKVVNQWADIQAGINAKKELFLVVNGVEEARSQAGEFLGRDPADSLQVGADTGSAVTENRGGGYFHGLIDSLRIYSGAGKP